MENDLETTQLINDLTSVLKSGVNKILCNYSKKQQNLERKQQYVTQTLIKLLETLESSDTFCDYPDKYTDNIENKNNVVWQTPNCFQDKPLEQILKEPEPEVLEELNEAEQKVLKPSEPNLNEYDDVSTITSIQDTKTGHDEHSGDEHSGDEHSGDEHSEEEDDSEEEEDEPINSLKSLEKTPTPTPTTVNMNESNKNNESNINENIEEEYFEIEIDDTVYVTTDENNGFIYHLNENGSISNKIIGYLKDGEVNFY